MRHGFNPLVVVNWMMCIGFGRLLPVSKISSKSVDRA